MEARIVAGQLAVAVILTTGFAGGGPGTTHDAGPTNGATYTSGLGNFSCTVPSLAQPGARQQQHSDADSAYVAFSDDLGKLIRIDSQRLPPGTQPRLDTAVLNRLYDHSIFPEMFGSVSPSSKTWSREHVTAAAGPALFALVNVPTGSNMIASDGAAAPQRLDSVRGTLVFSQNGFLYVISNQEWPVGEHVPRGTVAERGRRLLDELQRTVAGMTFPTR